MMSINANQVSIRFEVLLSSDPTTGLGGNAAYKRVLQNFKKCTFAKHDALIQFKKSINMYRHKE